MRICHILYNVYGKNASPYEYTQELSNLGHSVTVICNGNITEAGAVELIDLSKNKKNGSLSFARKALKFINKEKFDIVHVYHFRWSFFIPLLSKNSAKTFIDIRTGNVSSNLIKSKLGDAITKSELLFFNNKIAITEEIGNDFFNKSFHVLPLGVNIEKFCLIKENLNDDELEFKEDERVYLTHGSIDKNRKLSRLVKNFLDLVDEEKLKAKLIIIGDGNDLANLKNYCSKKNQSSIIFVGQVPHSNLSSYISQCDFGISYIPMVPQYDKQPPLKTVEYLSCGKPVLATNTVGNKIFVSNDNGILFDDNYSDFKRAVLSSFSQRFDKRSIKDGILKYSYKNIVRSTLLDIYDS